MFKNFNAKLVILLILAAVALSGCGLTVSTGSAPAAGTGSATDGGVFKTLNKGLNWQQLASIQTVGQAQNFASMDIKALAMDPSDNQAIYAGSAANGMFYSYNGAASWQITQILGSIAVNDIAVDPKNKCVVYVASENKVYKSSDCSRTWLGMYFDNDPTVKINSLAIDYNNSNNVFIGTTRGEIIKSADAGASWRTLNRFNSAVNKIAINPANFRIMYVGTADKGVFRTIDAGASWASLANQLKAFDDISRFRDLAMAKEAKMDVFLATTYGLLKSTDDGNSWTKIELITPEKDATINAVAVNPANVNEIYYVTNTTFYRSLDGGKTWSSRKLPTNRTGAKLLIDPVNPSVLYLAAKKASVK